MISETFQTAMSSYFSNALKFHSQENSSVSLSQVRENRAYLAQLILDKPAYFQQVIRYLSQLSTIVGGNDKLIANSLHCPDSTVSHQSKREPNILESLLSTLEMQKINNEFLQQLQNVGAVIPIGSLTYAPYYWITHSSGDKRPTDLDFEVVIDPNRISELPDILDMWGSENEDFRKFSEVFQSYYEAGITDFGTYRRKIPERNLWVDCHFIPESTLEKICQINLLSLTETTTLNEFRLHDKVPGHIYRQFGFNGREFSFRSEYSLNELGRNHGVIFEVPHVLFDPDKDQIGMGYSFDKYLSVCNQPILFDQKGTVTEQIITLAQSIATRLKYERANRPNENLVLSKALTSTVRMNPYYSSELDQYIESLLLR